MIDQDKHIDTHYTPSQGSGSKFRCKFGAFSTHFNLLHTHILLRYGEYLLESVE